MDIFGEERAEGRREEVEGCGMEKDGEGRKNIERGERKGRREDEGKEVCAAWLRHQKPRSATDAS